MTRTDVCLKASGFSSTNVIQCSLEVSCGCKQLMQLFLQTVTLKFAVDLNFVENGTSFVNDQ
jgi:hypothetical protein